MVERLIVAGIVLALVVLALWTLRLLPVLWRAHLRRVEASAQFAGGGDSPTLLYFFTQHCVDCRVRQAPALERLEEKYPRQFSLVKVDALEEQALARKYHVLTVPSTVVLDPKGRVVEANLGFAPAERLELQLGLN